MQTLYIKHGSGFTLVEMMAVVVVIGLALGAMLTLDFADSPQQQEQQAQRFANELSLATQEAVLDGAIWGLDFFSEAGGLLGYRWLRQEASAWNVVPLPGFATSEAWFTGTAQVELSSGAVVLKPEVRVVLETLPADTRFAPEVLLLPTREVTPFTLRLSGADAAPIVVTADLLGRIWFNDAAPASP